MISRSRSIRSGDAWKFSRKRPLDGDLPEAEIGVVEDLADDERSSFPSTVKLGFAVPEIAVDAGQVGDDVPSAISLRLLFRLFRILRKNCTPLMSCTLPRRSLGLRLVTIQT